MRRVWGNVCYFSFNPFEKTNKLKTLQFTRIRPGIRCAKKSNSNTTTSLAVKELTNTLQCLGSFTTLSCLPLDDHFPPVKRRCENDCLVQLPDFPRAVRKKPAGSLRWLHWPSGNDCVEIFCKTLTLFLDGN